MQMLCYEIHQCLFYKWHSEDFSLLFPRAPLNVTSQHAKGRGQPVSCAGNDCEIAAMDDESLADVVSSSVYFLWMLISSPKPWFAMRSLRYPQCTLTLYIVGPRSKEASWPPRSMIFVIHILLRGHESRLAPTLASFPSLLAHSMLRSYVYSTFICRLFVCMHICPACWVVMDEKREFTTSYFELRDLTPSPDCKSESMSTEQPQVCPLRVHAHDYFPCEQLFLYENEGNVLYSSRVAHVVYIHYSLSVHQPHPHCHLVCVCVACTRPWVLLLFPQFLPPSFSSLSCLHSVHRVRRRIIFFSLNTIRDREVLISHPKTMT